MAIYEYMCDRCGAVVEQLTPGFSGVKDDQYNGSQCSQCDGHLFRKVPHFKWHFSNEIIRGTKMEFSENTIENSIAQMQGNK